VARRRGATGHGGARRHAVVIGVALGLLVLIGFTALVLRLAETAVRREAEARVRGTAELTARVVEERTLRLAEVTRTGAQELGRLSTPRRARLTPGDAAVLGRVLTALRTDVTGVDSAVFTDALGRVTGAAGDGAPARGTDLSGRDWYRGARGRLGPAGAYVSRADLALGAARGPVVTVAMPVEGRGGRPVGLLAVTGRGRFQALADRTSADVVLTVTDQAGTIVGRSGRPARGLITRRGDPLVAAALRGGSGVSVRDLDGRPTVSGWAAVPQTGWAVVADVPAARAFTDVTRLRVSLLIGAAVVAFLLLWLVPLLAMRLGRARERIGVQERFQADLLPAELPPGVVAHYVASERRMLLGGDFLDAVRTPDGGLALLMGDVCGHGPRAAALAARLRASWRTLATAGVPLERMDVLDRVVVAERPEVDLFATVACAHVSADGEHLRYVLAGHPPLLLDADGVVERLDGPGRGPALGLVEGVPWPVAERELPPGWTLVMYTDGLIEARVQAGGERLEVIGLQALMEAAREEGRLSSAALVASVATLADPGGRGLDDDIAILVVDGSALGGRAAGAAVGGSAGG
jgi:serine phosphatase RsbU (regulator of sigma subunit)